MSALIKKSLTEWLLQLYRNTKYNRLDGYSAKSYSQEGEDMILRRIFEHKAKGFYVDVGAHHPKRFSNTYYFYKRGWCGINIEPNPGAIMLFNQFRPRDINLAVGVSDEPGIQTYFMFDESALNTFDEELCRQRQQDARYHLTGTFQIEMARLGALLNQYLPQGIEVDFVSIDTEGHDLNVLRSNNWVRYRPRVLLVERIEKSVEEVFSTELHYFLSEQKYRLFAKTYNTLFYTALKS
jgi:FkbM family methyltransferase